MTVHLRLRAGSVKSTVPGSDLFPESWPSAPFHVEVQREGRRVLIAATGELDLTTAGVLQTAIRRQVGSAKLLLLDLSGLTFMDAAGLRVVVAADAGARFEGMRVHVICGTGQARRLLTMLGTDDYIDFVKPRRV